MEEFLTAGSVVNPSRRGGKVAVACDVAQAVIAWLYLVYAYAAISFPSLDAVVCPFRLLSGWGCPLCGGTHFIGLFLRGTVDWTALPVVTVGWFVFVVGVGLVSSARLAALYASRRRAGGHSDF
jgi:hypothetical protein